MLLAKETFSLGKTAGHFHSFVPGLCSSPALSLWRSKGPGSSGHAAMHYPIPLFQSSANFDRKWPSRKQCRLTNHAVFVTTTKRCH